MPVQRGNSRPAALAPVIGSNQVRPQGSPEQQITERRNAAEQVQAVRAGNVAVANPLGSGLVETPALPAFLPALCRRLLVQELRLPSVPTRWCGDPDGLSHVLANLPRLVVKPTFVPARRRTVTEMEIRQRFERCRDPEGYPSRRGPSSPQPSSPAPSQPGIGANLT